MSRTYRNIEHARCIRNIRHANYRRNELAAVEAIRDAGFIPDNRLSSCLSRIPTNWEDFCVSAYGEVYHND